MSRVELVEYVKRHIPPEIIPEVTGGALWFIMLNENGEEVWRSTGVRLPRHAPFGYIGGNFPDVYSPDDVHAAIDYAISELPFVFMEI